MQMAPAFVFLACADSTFINGHCIHVRSLLPASSPMPVRFTVTRIYAVQVDGGAFTTS
jgi:hypothetical protein